MQIDNKPGEIRELDWDTTSGNTPKVGQIINNGFHEYKVIERKGKHIKIQCTK